MKKIVLFSVLVLAAFISNAQNVKFKKGQLLTITNNVTQEIDMGMAGQMSNSSNAVSVIEIKSINKDSYKATTKISKLKMNIDAMGDVQSFDSDKPEDLKGGIGELFGENIGKEFNITIDNAEGKVESETKKSPEADEKDEDPMSQLISMAGNAGNDGAMVASVIYILPKDKKAGESWDDSTEIKNGSKVYKTYTLKSLDNGMATIGLITKASEKKSAEQQGMQIDVTMDIKGDSEILVDTKTSIIKKLNRVVNIDGTMEVMGQSIPVTSKTTEVFEVN